MKSHLDNLETCTIKVKPLNISITPDTFEKYQNAIAVHGLTPMVMVPLIADSTKRETAKAILIKKGQNVAWVPKSVLFNYQEHESYVSMYVKENFKLEWSIDDHIGNENE